MALDDVDDVPAHETAFDLSRLDRDRTLRAMRRLENTLAMAAGAERWLPEVAAAFEALSGAMDAERHELNQPDSLLSMIAAEHPRRFSSWVRNLHDQYDDIIRQVGSLLAQLERLDDVSPNAGDLRQRAGWVITSLHHCRARQTDLVYEALTMDLGES